MARHNAQLMWDSSAAPLLAVLQIKGLAVHFIQGVLAQCTARVDCVHV